MNEIETMFNTLGLRERNIIDQNIKQIPTEYLPRVIQGFEALAQLAKLELEFRNLTQKLQ